MNKGTKAIVEILIKELLEILEGSNCIGEFPLKSRIQSLLQSWIKRNDLHPEEVQTIISSNAENNIYYPIIINTSTTAASNYYQYRFIIDPKLYTEQ